MVRLINTDWHQKSQEKDSITKSFLVDGSFKDVSFYGKKVQNRYFSLNDISKKNLDAKEFLIYVDDFQFSLLFDHKTLYCIPLEWNYFKKDLQKAIVLRMHIISILGMGQNLLIKYIINTRKDIEHELHHAMQLPNREIQLQSLGNIKDIIASSQPIDTKSILFSKYTTISIILTLAILFSIQGLPLIKERFFSSTKVLELQKNIQVEKQINTINHAKIKELDQDIKNIKEILEKEKSK